MKKTLHIIFICLIFTGMTAQNEETIAISADACDCMEEIDLKTKKEAQYEAINTCISNAIFSYQLTKGLESVSTKIKDSTNRTPELLREPSQDTSKQINIEIVADKNYSEIEAYSLRNCSAMKRILKSENTENEKSVSNKKKALEFYNKGQQYYDEGKFGNAIVEFSKAVRKDKNFVFAWDNLGLSYRQQGQYKQAVKSYEKSLEIDPNGRMPLINIPIAYEMMQDYDNAIKGYENLLAVYPDDPEGHYGLGRMYYVKNDYENALDNMMQAYTLYKSQNSPYIHDAESIISQFYKELKEKGQLELFNKIANKYNIKVQE